MFRMIEALEKTGHTCVLYLYDRFQGDYRRYTDVIRRGWPSVKAEVRDIAHGVAPLDGLVATNWQTAHVVASRAHPPTRHFYFIQDYEPFFYPRGSEYALAEDTYRFGFRCITLGSMAAEILREEVGIESAIAEFGCDTTVYRLTNSGFRSGVAFYSKPDVPRRGYSLSVLALAEFHRRHPEQPIHFFGERSQNADFPIVDHGNLSPSSLNALYNQTIAGLVMSFTNVSFVPEEMLASGTIPVVNDDPYARAGLRSRAVEWARPTPLALADRLCEVVERPDLSAQAELAAGTVSSEQWRPAQQTVVSAIEAEIYG